MEISHNIDRREAIRRAAILLGGVISAPTLAALLQRDTLAWAAAVGDTAGPWVPRTLSAAQLELVATIADRVIPPTDTPGGRAAGVHQFVDVLLTDYYPAAERDRFLAGLQGLDFRAVREHKRPFGKITRKQQNALLAKMDREAFPPRQMVADSEKKLQPPPRDPVVGPGANSTGAPPMQKPEADPEGMTDAIRSEMGSDWFWHRMKELAVVGYYSSQPGSTQELRVNPMGIWRGDIPYHRGDRAWA